MLSSHDKRKLLAPLSTLKLLILMNERVDKARFRSVSSIGSDVRLNLIGIWLALAERSVVR